MAQYSVLFTVFAVTVLIAHSLCFRVEPAEEPSVGEVELQPESRQVADNILMIQDASQAPSQLPTTAAPLPARIRDTIINNIRDFGNNVRQAPARVTECFQNITKCANTILRRNQTTSVQTLLSHEE